VLDGLEPLQNPPGPQEGRLRDPALQALLRELAAFNQGVCVITTRTPIADIADHERTSAPRRDLEQLSSDAGGRSCSERWVLEGMNKNYEQPAKRLMAIALPSRCWAAF
jgi:hypothetical protein